MTKELEQEFDHLEALLWSERDPEGRAFVPLADAHRLSGNLEKAREIVLEGLSRLPDFASALVVSGRIHRDLGLLGEAREAFERVLELDAENVEALRALGELSADSDDVDSALLYFERLSVLEPDDSDVVARIEALIGASGGPGGLDRDIRSAVQTRDESPAESDPEIAAESSSSEITEVYTRTMAELYVQQGLVERAVEVFEQLVHAEPDNEGLATRLRELSGGVDSSGEETASRPRDTPGVTSFDSSGLTVGEYFDGLFSWLRETTRIEVAPTQVPPTQVVPIESLAPDRPVDSRNVDSTDDAVVPIEALAPDK